VSRSLKNEHIHSSLSVSRSLKNETDNHEHSSLSVSSSLKNETDPPPIESSLPLDLVPEPSFPLPVSVDPLYSSLSSEPIPISSQESNWVQKKSQWMKQSLGGMSPASGHHAGVKPLDFVDHVGGKVPTFGHHVGKKPTNGYHSKNQPMDITLGRNPSMGIILSIVHFQFQAH
jgi:hypothetical protein